ncbi:sulfurtransferase, partial [Micromonospora aurantiaca]|nr:sulfurtransferase [Micromonospora aurantiaca]
MAQTPTRTERCPVPPPGSRGIDEILAAARTRLRRLDPEQAHLACRGGALLVDIRPAAQRAAQGTVPGSLVVERNVLEWRFDPRCAARLPQASGYDVPV